jgi:hypothetical protein
MWSGRQIRTLPKFAIPCSKTDVNFGIEGHYQLYDSSAALNPKFAIRLVWRFRSPHHSYSESEMRTSEPKPH